MFQSPHLLSLFDPVSLTIVLGGTVLATLLRCGLGETRSALRAAAHAVLATLGGVGRFRPDVVRARLAVEVQEIGRDGLVRARPQPTGDAEFDAALDALAHRRSLAAFHKVASRQRDARLITASNASQTLMQAADLAPVFGLAGTLFSLSRLPANGIDRSAYMAAIGMAVHATLYGLVAANLLLAPLGRLIERVFTREDAARQQLTEWLSGEIELVSASRLSAAAGGGRGEGGVAGGGPDHPRPDGPPLDIVYEAFRDGPIDGPGADHAAAVQRLARRGGAAAGEPAPPRATAAAAAALRVRRSRQSA